MAVLVTIRPYAVVGTADLAGHDPTTVVPGGTDRVVALTDGSDATYHTSEVGHFSALGAEGRVTGVLALEDVAGFPAGGRIEWVRPTVRHKSHPPYRSTLHVYLGPSPDSLQLSPLRAFWDLGPITDDTAPWTIQGPMFAKMQTGGSSAGPLEGGQQVDWTVDAVNAMAFAAWLFPQLSVIDLVAVWFDVSYRRRGEVAGITPATGSTIAVTKPVIGWTPVAADNPGTPQRGYEVRVYSEAQYSAVGFDPWNTNTFPPTWSTPHVLDASARSVQVDTRLQDGVRYRAYVFVEQPWSGTAGSWWSAKPATATFGGKGDPYYTEFLVDLPSIGGPTLTVAAYDESAAVRLSTSGFVPGVAEAVSIEIQRSEDRGATWSEVRGSPFAAAVPGTARTFWDDEARRGRELRYRARSITEINTSDWSAAATEVGIVSTMLKDPLDRTRNRPITLLAPFKPRRRRPQSSSDALGRDEPITTSDGFKGWEADCTIQTVGLEEYQAVDAMLASGRVLLIQDAIGRQWYLEVGDGTDHDELRASPSGAEEQFPVRHLNRISFAWRSADPPA
jgi:hypothetical protein